jgi:hypothetical protein
MLLTPCGNPRPVPLSLNRGYAPADAYRDGANAYNSGQPLGLSVAWPEDLRGEWSRGYRIARKRDRFNATIRSRRVAAT